MVIQIPLPKPINILHLYRHLLREVSYLPRPCRQYARGQIFHHFRRNQYRNTRVQEHIHDGYTALRMIRAANAGELDRMHRIILLTYGRLGEHRQRRMKGMIRWDGPRNSEELQKGVARVVQAVPGPKGRNPPKKTKILEKWPLQKILKYLEKQKEQQDLMPKVKWPAKDITSLDPWKSQHIPEKSVWGQPLEGNALRYRLSAWWRKLQERVLPPMTETKFKQLRDLANGVDDGKPLKIIPRRKIDSQELEALKKEQESAEWNFSAELTAPTALLERQKSRPFLRKSGLKDDSPWRVGEQSPLTVKNLQRLFRFVFFTASVLRMNPVTGKRENTWGRFEYRVPEADKKMEKLFEGVSKTTGFPENHPKHQSSMKVLEGMARARDRAQKK